MVEFPSWWKPEEGAPPVYFHIEARVPKGWIHVPGSYNFQTGQWIDAEPESGDDIKALRGAYKEKFGKRPFNGWDETALREKLG